MTPLESGQSVASFSTREERNEVTKERGGDPPGFSRENRLNTKGKSAVIGCDTRESRQRKYERKETKAYDTLTRKVVTYGIDNRRPSP